jgi:hypothetical protein
MVILSCLIGCLLFLLLLLALPVELSFFVEKEEALRYRATLHWLFGLVSIDMPGKRKTAEKKFLPVKPKRKKPHLKSLFKGGIPVKRLLWLMRRLLHRLQIRELKLHGRIGLGDPAYTGMLMGALHPLLPPGRNITLIADFQEAVFEGYCSARIRLYPIRVIGTLLVFLLSKNR